MRERDAGSAAALVTALALLLTIASVAGADEDARPLMREVWAGLRNLETERDTLDVLVVVAPEKARYRPDDAAALVREHPRGTAYKRAVRSIRYARDGNDKLHVVLAQPSEDRGTAFLVWRKPGEDQDDQWLFLPALKRARRIPASSTQTFVGTDFIYEDVRSLTSEAIERFDYVAIGDEVVDGASCTLVRAAPKPGTSSAYGSRIIAIDKASRFPVRVAYHDQQGKPWKLQYNASPREVAPGVWRPELTEMRNLELGETTLISFAAREVNPRLSDEVFTQDYLERWTGE